MTHVNVTFYGDDPEIDFPVTVRGVDIHLFGEAGGNLAEMTDEDLEEHHEFVLEITPKDAITVALEIIHSAPGFDDVPVSEVDRAGVTATVEYEIER